MIPKIIRWIGIGLFAISFFLPAVGGNGGGWAMIPNQFPGWLCALSPLVVLGSIVMAAPQGFAGPSPPWLQLAAIFVAGLVVPMVLIYLFLCASREGSRKVRTRKILALAILAGLASAWSLCLEIPGLPLMEDAMKPLIGHYLWTLGILLILTPEIISVSNGDSAIG